MEPISGTMNFIIDPIDSAVLGYGFTDKEGRCSFSLSRSLKSRKFLFKVFGMGYKSTMMEIDHWQSERVYYLPWEYETTRLLTVYVHKNGPLMVHDNPVLDSIPFVYYRRYCDTANYYAEVSSKAFERYQMDRLNFEKEMAWIDSAKKASPELSFLYPQIPAPPEWLVQEELCTSVCEHFWIEGGWERFYEPFKKSISFQTTLRNNKKLRVYFSFDSNEEPFVERIVVCNKKLRRIKSLTRFCKKFEEEKMKWHLIKLNGRSAKLNNEMEFYIDFIYEKH